MVLIVDMANFSLWIGGYTTERNLSMWAHLWSRLYNLSRWAFMTWTHLCEVATGCCYSCCVRMTLMTSVSR